MKETKHLLFTFDYELFLGSRSGTAANCILLPTQKVLDIFNKYGISHAIFFVDTTYLLTLKNNPAAASQEDFKKVCDQIKRICRDGHYVFPHLHPHWLDAVYLPDINQWDLSNTSKYSFSAVAPPARERLFAESVQLLEDICGKQEAMGYRAGGWCIQPFSDFKPFFEKHDIEYDFTVMQGFYSEHFSQKFDFRHAPDKSSYRFEESVELENASGKFTEIPISTLAISYVNKILNKFLIKLLYRKGVTNYGDGFSTYSASLAEIKTRKNEMASIENLTVVNMNDYKRAIGASDYLQFISHPKMLTPFNIACFDELLKEVTKKYTVNTDFRELVPQKKNPHPAKKNKVLIISYVFPPYPGIGGRRWAKFAKYLNEKNTDVYVISAKNPFSETSVWMRDVKKETLHKTAVPHKYPSILEDTPFSNLKRLKYKLALSGVERKTRGSIYDRAVFAGDDIIKAASVLIEKHAIDHIICTGAPFSILHYGTQLKKKYPHLKLMSDIRDPWTWGIAYGFGKMEEKRLNYETTLEKEVIELSDLVTVPVDPMRDHLLKKYPGQQHKIMKLPHGIDKDDLPGLYIPEGDFSMGLTRLIYSGTIYPGAEKILSDFAGILASKEVGTIQFDIYTLSKKNALTHRFANTPVHIHEPVPPANLFGLITQYDFYVSFVTEQYKDFISTKYFEIIYLKKPIVLISPKGVLSDFIMNNHLGIHFLPSELDKLVHFLSDHSSFSYNTDFKLDEFFYDKLTDVVIRNFIEKDVTTKI